jgi:hypothetical protein
LLLPQLLPLPRCSQAALSPKTEQRVEAQGLFYDSFVLADLPSNGRFRQLKPGEGPSGLATEFGPGDVGYLGGRWWIDANGNEFMDDVDAVQAGALAYQPPYLAVRDGGVFSIVAVIFRNEVDRWSVTVISPI